MYAVCITGTVTFRNVKKRGKGFKVYIKKTKFITFLMRTKATKVTFHEVTRREELNCVATAGTSPWQLDAVSIGSAASCTVAQTNQVRIFYLNVQSDCRDFLTCGEVNERVCWLWRQSDAHGPPDAVHAAHVTRSHLTRHLRQVLRHLLSCQRPTEALCQRWF